MAPGRLRPVPDDLVPGIYEELVTTALNAKLANLDPGLVVKSGLRSADAADRIALHLANQVMRTIEAIPEHDRVTIGMTIARRLITELVSQVPRSAIDDQIPSGDVLHGIAEWLPDGSVRKTAPPLIPLLDTTLLTNSPGEPRVGMQILTEIESADAVDMVMAFVRRSGLRPLMSALRAHCRTRPQASSPDDDLHRIDRTRGPRSAGRAGRRDSGFVRRYDHSPARQGLALPPPRLPFDRLYRLVQPHPFGPGGRSGVERPRLRRPQPGHHQQDGCRLRQLLGERRLRFVRPGTVRRVDSTRPKRPKRHPAQSDRDSPRTVSGATTRTGPHLTRARPSPQPARLGDRHRQDGDGGGRLRPPAR